MKYFCIFARLHEISIGNQNVIKIHKNLAKYYLKIESFSSVRGAMPQNPSCILNHKGSRWLQVMGVARILFGGTLFQEFSKYFQKNSKNFRKFLKFFLRKLLKMPYFSIFAKNLAIHALNFCAFGPKTQFVGDF